jgi:hypothetical protein
MRRVLGAESTGGPRIDGSIPAAHLVRQMRVLIHRNGGFGVVRKRGQKMPAWLVAALAFLSKRVGWVVRERPLGRGAFAGRSWRVVWGSSKVLQRAVRNTSSGR